MNKRTRIYNTKSDLNYAACNVFILKRYISDSSEELSLCVNNKRLRSLSLIQPGRGVYLSELKR